MKNSIWTVLLSHRHGNEVHVFPSRNAALLWLAGYCERWWDDVPGDLGMPTDPQERVDAYFEHVANELAHIEDHELSMSEPIDALLREALDYEAEAFENDTEVNGADLVDWFCDWRTRAKTSLES